MVLESSRLSDNTKVSLFEANYGQNPRIEFEGKKKKYEAVKRFVERMKRI